MKKKLSLLTIVGALLVLAIPASSSASMFPAGAKFEFGEANGPKVATSLGSCWLKVSGTIPKAPENEKAGFSMGISAPVPTCSAGTTLTLSGTWNFVAAGNLASVTAPTPQSETLVMRSTSLPNCKLVANGIAFLGLWSNGTTTPSLLKSGYHAHSTQSPSLTWANDGGACAVAGKAETLKWESAVSGGNERGLTVPVNNLTTPTAPIIVGN